MPFDITHPHDDHDHKPSPELDKMFLSRIIQFPEMQGFRYMPPELVAAMKADIGRRKDRRDLKLINQHLH